MRKDTSKYIDLNALLSEQLTFIKPEAIVNGIPPEVIARIDLVDVYGLDQKVVDSMTTTMVLKEYSKYTNSKDIVNIDFDTVLTEWSWRCDKGYPDYNNISDRLKLQEVLDEMEIPLPFERLTEAVDVSSLLPKLSEKFQNNAKQNKFIDYINKIPGSIVKRIAAELEAIADTDKLVEEFNSKDLESIKGIDIKKTGVFESLYNIDAKGIGPGEMLLSWLLGEPVVGGSLSYDIQYESDYIEVKSMRNDKKSNSIDPGNKYASIEQYALTDELKKFFKTIVTPYYLGNPVNNKVNTLRSEIMSLTSDKDKTETLNGILDVFEKEIPSTTATGEVALSDTIREMTPKLFSDFYNAITKIHEKINSIKDLENLASIEVQTDTDNVQYWIDMEDAKDIVNNAGQDKNVSIKVGDKVETDNEKAKIWLANFMKNKFIKDPEYFVTQLKAIRDRFITKEGGNKTKLVCIIGDKFKVYDNMNDFFTSSITRSNYRFDLKNKFTKPEFKYVRKQ